MRVISGDLRGRQFVSPPGNRTHPMSDKVRGALFNILGDIKGLTVLDAFAGSGALSIEAISRGAASVVAVDIDRGAINTIVKNLKELGIQEQVKAIRANASAWSDTVYKANPRKTEFDVVICDPPYDELQMNTLQKLSRHVGAGGLFVLSWPGNLAAPEFVGLERIAQKSYGDAQLVFYRKLR